VDDTLARYRAAYETQDVDGVVATLAPGAELVSPISGRLVFRGTDDLRALFTALFATVTRITWDREVGDGPVRVLVGTAAVGPFQLTDAMVVELDGDGRIERLRPHLRPWLGLTVLALTLGPRVARHPGVVRRALRRG
jgi:hypothetical protein